MKQTHRKIPSPVVHRPLETDVSLANQRRYHRALRNGGLAYVIGKRLAGTHWRV